MVNSSIEAARDYRKSLSTSKSKPKPANHNPRAVKWLQDRGYSTIVKVEHELAYSMRKSDLLACDFLAISTQVTEGKVGSLLLVQVCSLGSRSARLRKMAQVAGLKDWIVAGGEVGILAFRKVVSPRGAVRWEPEWSTVSLGDLIRLEGAKDV